MPRPAGRRQVEAEARVHRHRRQRDRGEHPQMHQSMTPARRSQKPPVVQNSPLQWTHRRSILETAVAQAGKMARLLRGNPPVGIYLAYDEPFYVAPPRGGAP